MMGSADHPWRVPGLLALCFTAGVIWSMIPALPPIIGAVLAGAPIAIAAWSVRRASRP